MSLDPILWALKDAPVADSTERLVLVTLAERAARSDGCTSFPSRETIAKTALIDPKTVQRVLRRLEQRGLIAKGDQSAARYIRADRRPVVWDALIPFSWFPNPERMNEERRQAGLFPLTPQDRPDIAEPPERKRRSDAGQARSKAGTAPRGDSESPGSEDDGGTDSPARGDCESGTGGLEDPRYSPLILPEEPPLSRASVPELARTELAKTETTKTVETRSSRAALVERLAQEHQAEEVEIEAVLSAVRREGRIRYEAAWAGSEAGREDLARRLDERRRSKASRVVPGALREPGELDRLAGVEERAECGCGALLMTGTAVCGRCEEPERVVAVQGLEGFRAARAGMNNRRSVRSCQGSQN